MHYVPAIVYLQYTEQTQLCVQWHVRCVVRMHGVTRALHEHCHAAVAAEHLRLRLRLHLRCPRCRYRCAAPAPSAATVRSNILMSSTCPGVKHGRGIVYVTGNRSHLKGWKWAGRIEGK